MKYNYTTGVKYSLVGWSLRQVFIAISMFGWMLLVLFILDCTILNSNLITRLM